MQRILVVDDDATVRELIADILGFNGYLVIEARDAGAAIGDVTAHGPPSLLLTDLVMPGMNGRELAAWLHERHPGIPVVFSSGYDEQAPALPEAGTYSLAKPYVPSALLRTVARALAEHRA